MKGVVAHCEGGRLMLVTKQLERNPSGGRELLCRLNLDALRGDFGEQPELFELAPAPVRGPTAILHAFSGWIDGLNARIIADALAAIRERKVAKLFIDGSNLGALVEEAKRVSPRLEVITFFHNVESRFFLGSLRRQKSLRALAVLLANYLAERKAVRYSDKIICLSERDSRLLKRVYGRGATHISPMALEDKAPLELETSEAFDGEPYALFVGGTFYANRAGIEWFVRRVVPRINLKICIVGRGFEALRGELEVPGKVEVVGAVESLADWYRRARFVIAPIFDGSGMKTKVAEALMYGKKVVGTPEAFSGYEEIASEAGWTCETADDFVAAIETAQASVTQMFDPALRQIFLQTYSLPAARVRLQKILDDPPTRVDCRA